MTTFKTEIRLGTKYVDNITGFVGTAVSVHHYEHACERVTLRAINAHGEVIESAFDAPELSVASTGRQLTSARPGGPRDLKPPARR